MGLAQIADGGDAITADSNIRGKPGISGAVDHVTVADDEIVVASIRGGIQVSVIGRRGNFSEGLTGHLLSGFRIRVE